MATLGQKFVDVPQGQVADKVVEVEDQISQFCLLPCGQEIYELLLVFHSEVVGIFFQIITHVSLSELIFVRISGD